MIDRRGMVARMEGVTTAIVGFILACLVFPKVIKNKPQYYAAVGLILVVILLSAIAAMTNPASGFRKFALLLTAFLQVGAIFVLILSAGGLTVGDLAGDLADTFEVIRRGGEEKEIIIPRRGDVPRPRGARVDPDDENGPTRIDLDAELRASHPPPVASPAPPAAHSRGDEDDRGIPLA